MADRNERTLKTVLIKIIIVRKILAGKQDSKLARRVSRGNN